jgi:hypothetical protein
MKGNECRICALHGCSEEFRPKRRAQEYCSPKCRRAAAYGRERFQAGTSGRRKRLLRPREDISSTILCLGYKLLWGYAQLFAIPRSSSLHASCARLIACCRRRCSAYQYGSARLRVASCRFSASRASLNSRSAHLSVARSETLIQSSYKSGDGAGRGSLHRRLGRQTR